MPVIDVHTHIFTRPWLELLKRSGGLYNIQQRPDGQFEVFRGQTPVVIPQAGHFDYDLRIAHMDAAGIDVSIMSLTCPNVFWGGETVSCEAARETNASLAQAQARYPRRLRWFASLPWEYPARAVEELRMLSNFQFGNQALLQSFLIGQPEFREILQRPEMEQFRQRVAATCHIGPLDAEETTAYIEHRLKCAGSSGKPGFEPDALQAIHKASHGIPRRINAICDRLLLLGFLCERTDLSVADVDEVVREFANESMVPNKPQAAQGLAVQPDEAGNGHAVLLGDEAAIDLSSVSLDPALATRIGRQLDMLSADQTMDQLQRLERSVLRLERMNVQTLGMLKKLVSAVKKSSSEGAP